MIESDDPVVVNVFPDQITPPATVTLNNPDPFTLKVLFVQMIGRAAFHEPPTDMSWLPAPPPDALNVKPLIRMTPAADFVKVLLPAMAIMATPPPFNSIAFVMERPDHVKLPAGH